MSLKDSLKKYIPEEIVYFVRKRIQSKPYSCLVYDRNNKNLYDEDALISHGKNLDFLEESDFKLAYENAVEQKLYVSSTIRWRLHTLCWAAHMCTHLDGDFVECGVNKGFSSKVIMDYVRFKNLNKKYYLLDTFEGLSEAMLTESEKAMGKTGGGYEPCIDIVNKVFGELDFVRIIKGLIPDTLELVKAEKISFLHIDMNCVFPESEALKFFWPKLVKGGVVIFDDYGWMDYREQKIAHDEFASKVGLKIMTLPTGQGMLIKPYEGIK